MAALFALLASFSWGATDFLGGLMSKRDSAIAVTFWRSLLAVPVVVFFALVVDGRLSSDDLGWALAAGVSGIAALLLLLKGLADGRMGVVAPLAGMVSASLPVLFGLVDGERPAIVQLVGMATAIVSIVLVSMTMLPHGCSDDSDSGGRSPSPSDVRSGGTDGSDARVAVAGHATLDQSAERTRRDVFFGVGAGVCFGLNFVFLHQTSPDSGLMVLPILYLVNIVVAFVLSVIGRQQLRKMTSSWKTLAFAAAIDPCGSVFFVLASHEGEMLSIVGVLSSLYPVVTVILARVILREHFSRVHQVGLAATAVSLACIGAG